MTEIKWSEDKIKRIVNKSFKLYDWFKNNGFNKPPNEFMDMFSDMIIDSDYVPTKEVIAWAKKNLEGKE